MLPLQAARDLSLLSGPSIKQAVLGAPATCKRGDQPYFCSSCFTLTRRDTLSPQLAWGSFHACRIHRTTKPEQGMPQVAEALQKQCKLIFGGALGVALLHEHRIDVWSDLEISASELSVTATDWSGLVADVAPTLPAQDATAAAGFLQYEVAVPQSSQEASALPSSRVSRTSMRSTSESGGSCRVSCKPSSPAPGFVESDGATSRTSPGSGIIESAASRSTHHRVSAHSVASSPPSGAVCRRTRSRVTKPPPSPATPPAHIKKQKVTEFTRMDLTIALYVAVEGATSACDAAGLQMQLPGAGDTAAARVLPLAHVEVAGESKRNQGQQAAMLRKMSVLRRGAVAPTGMRPSGAGSDTGRNGWNGGDGTEALRTVFFVAAEDMQDEDGPRAVAIARAILMSCMHDELWRVLPQCVAAWELRQTEVKRGAAVLTYSCQRPDYMGHLPVPESADRNDSAA
eukprot:jgi/Ulvmu1/629/UM001_0637.1